MRVLIATSGSTPADAETLAVLNGCSGYYLECPPVWQYMSVAQGWTFPCVVTDPGDGSDVGWTPAVTP